MNERQNGLGGFKLWMKECNKLAKYYLNDHCDSQPVCSLTF